MTHNFESLPLARLYEKQGYIDDALDMYKALDTSQSPDAKEIIDAIARLEAQKNSEDVHSNENPKESNHDVSTSDPVQDNTQEAGMAHMLEVWLRLIFMQKRVDIIKTIKARL